MSKELCYATLLWELGTMGFFHILHVPQLDARGAFWAVSWLH